MRMANSNQRSHLNHVFLFPLYIILIFIIRQVTVCGNQRFATQPTFIIFHSNATENLPMSVNSHADLPRADSGLPPDPFLFELATYQFCAPTWWFTPGSKWVSSPQFIQQGKQGQCRYNWGCNQLIDQGELSTRPATRPTKPTMGSLPQFVGKTYNASMIRDM